MPNINNDYGYTIEIYSLDDYGTIDFLPSLEGNAFYLAAFALIFFIQGFPALAIQDMEFLMLYDEWVLQLLGLQPCLT
jgi:hypothetical protein